MKKRTFRAVEVSRQFQSHREAVDFINSRSFSRFILIPGDGWTVKYKEYR